MNYINERSYVFKKVLILLGLSVSFLFVNRAMNTELKSKLSSMPVDAKRVLILPINITSSAKNKTHLVIQIPKDYKCLQDDTLASVQEFIPTSDTDTFKWSKILTTELIVGQRLSARERIALTKQFFLLLADEKVTVKMKDSGPNDKASEVKIITEENRDLGTHQQASATISYTVNGRSEIMFLSFFSGPYDCAGFSYSIALDSKTTVADATKAYQDFIKNNVEIIKK